MKQVIQSYKTGKLEVIEVPVTLCRRGGVLVRNVASLISAGTEKSGLKLARKNIIGKARDRPDLVKKVWHKVHTEGVKEAYRQSMGRLDQPVALGYSCAGEVIETGEEAGGFRIGDRVACFGSGWASHAEVIFIPKNLCAEIPAEVSMEEATFAGMGAIALHGTRLLNAGLGETVVVIGLGLLGLISLQLLKASGVRVVGMDPEEWKVKLARELGADEAYYREEDVIRRVYSLTGNAGADAVIVLAATKSQRPVELAAELARERAVIAVPGLVGLYLPRSIFYQKELRLVVPHSAGPGVDDVNYEERGWDYPLQYVRWSARRNMEGLLYMVAEKKINLRRLITHHFPIEQAEQAYEIISDKNNVGYMGIMLTYPGKKKYDNMIQLKNSQRKSGGQKETVGVGLIGAGLFAKGTLLPAIKDIPWIRLKGLATATGSSGMYTGRKWGFGYCTTDYTTLLHDPEIDCLLITTRHNLHASLVIEALKCQKEVLVEKPLAINRDELEKLLETCGCHPGKLMVGYMRRFSRLSQQARTWITQMGSPLVINYRVNTGFVSGEHWAHDEQESGGRIIGEVGHFLDLIQYLSGSQPIRVFATTVSPRQTGFFKDDNLVVTLDLKDGSVAVLTYTASGDKTYGRERIEIFGGNSVCTIDNFREVVFIQSGKKIKKTSKGVDWGYRGEFKEFFKAVKEGREMPVDLHQSVNATLGTFAIRESLRSGKPCLIE